MVELDLPSIVKIYSVVSMSRIAIYKKQVKIQKLELLLPVIINSRKEYKVEKVLNK